MTSQHVEALKKVSSCSNCGDCGHWAEDCKKPYRSKAERLEQERSKNPSSSNNAFVFLGCGSSSTSYVGGPSLMAAVGSPSDADSKHVFLNLTPGHTVIDPGAGQDLIGKLAYDKLEKKLASVGLRPIKVDDQPPSASGIGGQVFLWP